MAAESAPVENANHITGDYYFVNDVSTFRWLSAAFLSVTLPPVGGFLVAWFAVGCITSKDDLTADESV